MERARLRMSETMHKADWRARVCRGAGVLVLLAGVLFAAGLCVADTPHDSPVSGSMHSTLSDPAFWSRFQFGFTLVYHDLFPQPTMGLGWFLVNWKWRALKTGDEKYNQAVRFWAKIFGLNLPWALSPVSAWNFSSVRTGLAFPDTPEG
jgi:hypothetical protein